MQAHYGSTLIRRYDQTYHEGAIDSYDNTVLFADRLLEDLTSFIRGNHPDTLVIITSDHGEEFLEHRGYLHARTLYNEILRVPLVLMGPGIPRGQSVSRLTDHTDLFATVLDYLGLPPSATQGESLLRKPHGKGALVYAEKRNGLSAMRTLISEEGKFIEQKPEVKGRTKPPMAGNGRWSFYRDPTGPDHRNEISSLSRARLIQAREEFQRISDRNKSILEKHAAGSRIQREMTDEELEALRALGYAE
jgi:arylsulfatase A-like enzyme